MHIFLELITWSRNTSITFFSHESRGYVLSIIFFLPASEKHIKYLCSLHISWIYNPYPAFLLIALICWVQQPSARNKTICTCMLLKTLVRLLARSQHPPPENPYPQRFPSDTLKTWKTHAHDIKIIKRRPKEILKTSLILTEDRYKLKLQAWSLR